MTKSVKYQHKLIEAGLCLSCKQPVDRNGRYCKECLEKHNQRRKDDVEFYLKHGLCRICGKNKSQPGSTYCENCSQYMYEYNKKRWEEKTDYCRQKKRESEKKRYEECKSQGICTRCRSRKAMKGKTKCGVCLEKDRLRHKYGYKRDKVVNE